MRVGFGYDAHRLVEGRDLILGGVTIPHEKGLLGHSDADVLLHAIIDAMIGSIAGGSIGDFFPDTDPKYKGIASTELLKETVQMLCEKGFIIANIDSTIVCQEPKIKPYVSQMIENISTLLKMDKSHINIKGKTEEGMGFTGTKEGISAYAVVLVHKRV